MKDVPEITLSATPTATIERRPLFEQLADQVRTMILDGDLEPGARLQEKELSERFGVSRTPLREALKVLSSEGLITLAPNRGASVRALDPKEVAETFPVMAALEALAGELACAHATDQEITAFSALHHELMAQYRERDIEGYFATNQKIHRLIMEAARNEILLHHYDLLAGRVSRARYRAAMTKSQWSASVREHEDMVAAFLARDGGRLSAVLRAHIGTKYETVRGSL